MILVSRSLITKKNDDSIDKKIISPAIEKVGEILAV